MEEYEYGKVIWTDDSPKSSEVWKTTLLLLTVIFVMNSIWTFYWLYPVLAFGGAVGYMYFASQPDSMSFRMKVYEKGIFASVYSGEEKWTSRPKETFFEWKDVKSVRVERKGRFPKKSWLYVTAGKGTYSSRLEKRDAFISACRKLNKEVMFD
jgi:hypothetical protein